MTKQLTGPFFECPGCGKDIADMRTSHAPDCPSREPEPGYCSCGRHSSDQCAFCRSHIDGSPLVLLQERS